MLLCAHATTTAGCCSIQWWDRQAGVSCRCALCKPQRLSSQVEDQRNVSVDCNSMVIFCHPLRLHHPPRRPGWGHQRRQWYWCVLRDLLTGTQFNYFNEWRVLVCLCMQPIDGQCSKQPLVQECHHCQSQQPSNQHNPQRSMILDVYSHLYVLGTY